MARPQSFDRPTVLSKALQVFWQKGYDGASIQDLVDATGLNRGSLYNSFGDKEEMFAEVMALYRSQSSVKILVNAPLDANVRALFNNFFQALVERAQNDLDQKGCLMTNTAAGFYGCSDRMTDWVCDAVEGMETLFVKLIERGQAAGDIASSSSPLKLARFLMASAHGLNVMASLGSDPSALEDIANQSLQALD